jgi:Ulp1 family protease
MEEEGAIVLTHNNTTLYESDLDLLKPGVWLNDNLINFYWE